jgi:hypothetical protein
MTGFCEFPIKERLCAKPELADNKTAILTWTNFMISPLMAHPKALRILPTISGEREEYFTILYQFADP